MAKEIQFSLVYRDMWQSSGKYVPRKDQLERIAPVIVDMGCFARIETNGGGFEQINLLFGENPNKAVRAWTKPFNEAGIQTHMLERGLNGIRMNPVPVDIRKLMFKVKKKQGTDIARSFCGLNDPRNIIDSAKYAKEGGMIAQSTLSLTHSAVHTVDYYVDLAQQLIDGGADEICLKDMAGIGRPASLGKIVAGIKASNPDILIQYHGQTGPGFTPASILEVARAGCEIIDVGMEPLSWGTGHADLLMVIAMLKDAGYSVPDVNMKAYMEARALTQEFMDDFLGYYIPQRNRMLNSLLIGPGLPGGMMGSLMADLENNLNSINKWLTKNNKPTITQDELLVQLFDEVEFIWPKLGYPPLVTPYSQYVKNVAMMNVMSMIKGKERFAMIDDNTWDMLLGKAGKLPGKLAPEIVGMAEKQGREFFTGNPQDLYPDALPEFRKEMDDNGWDYGEDDEELMELAMHSPQYRNYKSGKAKADFEKELAEKKGAKAEKSAPAPAAAPSGGFIPKTLNVDVNGEKFVVAVSYGDAAPAPAASDAPPAAPAAQVSVDDAEEIIAPIEGNFHRTKSASEVAINVGDTIKEGDI
ncbi:MAG: oxaloacetate decarboxylase, partial [Cyclobacteriaceae bacterium]|nr:oxaloacetate decarboxylase [Cyclobacteriaceae bacterium]